MEEEKPKTTKQNFEYEGADRDEKQKQAIKKLEDKKEALKTLPKSDVVDKKINQVVSEIIREKKSD
jgi:hypothetical protein